MSTRLHASVRTADLSKDSSVLAGLQTWAGEPLQPLQSPQATDGPVWVAADATQPERVLASLCVRRRVGLSRPRAWYRLGWAVHAAAELQLFRQQRTLLLGHDLTGMDELTGFGLRPGVPDDQALALWAALAQAALQALAAPPGDAAVPCMAELPGVLDGQGLSPFWSGLGRHFYARDLAAARQAHGTHFDGEVSALLPRHLMYASFLPPAAQAAMGRCSPAAQALQAALRGLGFRWRDHIAVTDGGPVMVRDAD